MKRTAYDFGDGRGPVPAHQHENGGGWAEDTATLERTAFVASTSRVMHRAKVFDKARVEGKGIVQDDAVMRDQSICRGHVGGIMTLHGHHIVQEGQFRFAG